jgi:hypothetical protein
MRILTVERSPVKSSEVPYWQSWGFVEPAGRSEPAKVDAEADNASGVAWARRAFGESMSAALQRRRSSRLIAPV